MLAILPLAVRDVAASISDWRQAREATAEAEKESSAATIEQAIRAEWIAALDLSTLSSADQAKNSVFATRTETFVAHASSQFRDAGARVEEAFATSADFDFSAFDGRQDVLLRVTQGSIIPAELDLFYGRAIDAWAEEFEPTSGASFEGNREAVVATQVHGELVSLNDAVSRLRYELTVVGEQVLTGGVVEWSSLADRNEQVMVEVRDLDQFSFSTAADWTDTRTALISVTESVDGIVKRSPAASSPTIESDLASILLLREQLADLGADIGAEQTVALGRSLAATQAVQNAAASSLLLTSVLVLVGTVVTGWVALRATRWIGSPLADVAERARRISSGDLTLSGTAINGPREVEELQDAFDRVVDTVSAIQSQAAAISSGDTEAAVLDQRLPGSLGRTLEQSVGRWRDTTVQLQHELSHDEITDLASRRYLVARSMEILEQDNLAVAVVAIDHFKDVNDSVGRAVADQVLKKIGRRIEEASTDTAITARLWSDEFAILLPASRRRELASIVDRVVMSLERPISVGSNSWRIGTTIGIAEGAQIDSVLTDAATALRHGKRRGGGMVVEHNDDFAELLDRRSAIEAELIEAIETDGLAMYFQPVISLDTRSVTSLEALVRWPQPDGTVRGPSEFTPIAEESDLIIDLDRWVIREVCRTIASWQDTPLAAMPVAINLSARHVLSPGLAQIFESACDEFNISNGALAVELTESYFADNRDVVRQNLEALQALGVEILLDDFGTGYSCLAYLRDLSFNALKIDRSFVEQLETDREDAERLIGAIISLAEAMGLTTIAEGVARVEDLQILKDLGCDRAQGFGISKPMPVGPELHHFCGSRQLSLVPAPHIEEAA